MIQSRAELRRILKYEKSLYKKNGARKQIVDGRGCRKRLTVNRGKPQMSGLRS